MRRISKILLMASSFLGVAIALYILIIGQVFKTDVDTFFLGRVSFYLVAAIHLLVSLISVVIYVKMYVLKRKYVHRFLGIVFLAFISFGLTFIVQFSMSVIAMAIIYSSIEPNL